jgi:hypothetical protein
MSAITHRGASASCLRPLEVIPSDDGLATHGDALVAAVCKAEQQDLSRALRRTGPRAGAGAAKWRASRADLGFGSFSQLHAVACVYAEAGGEAKFVCDFIKASTKAMNPNTLS